ncbi:MAG: GNAT family N-acetyltransferase [Kiloniellales bacterium]|nr:GNAT family N-acetyltransferase [Kiloniellales bacterium]
MVDEKRAEPRDGARPPFGAGALDIRPATAERWPDFEALLGERGGCGGCWCMLWRLQRREFEAQGGAGNRAAMKALFEAGAEPGLIAYDGALPVGWCSVASRTAFPRLERSRVLKPVDDREVWSLSCFLVRKSHRNRGVSRALLQAAGDFVRARGGRILEGYPIDPKTTPYPAVYAWTGLASAFRAAGFEEVLRRSETRPILRKRLDGG